MAHDDEITTIEKQLTDLASPPELLWGIWVLVGFAFVGVVVPRIMLARRPVPGDATARLLVVALFTAGLGSLLAYLLVITRRLRRN